MAKILGIELVDGAMFYNLPDNIYDRYVKFRPNMNYSDGLLMNYGRDVIMCHLNKIVDWSTNDINKKFIVDSDIAMNLKRMRVNKELLTGVYPYIYAKGSRLITDDPKLKGGLLAPAQTMDGTLHSPTANSDLLFSYRNYDVTFELRASLETNAYNVEYSLFDKTKSKVNNYVCHWNQMVPHGRYHTANIKMASVLPKKLLYTMCVAFGIDFDIDILCTKLNEETIPIYRFKRIYNNGTGCHDIRIEYTVPMMYVADRSMLPEKFDDASYRLMRSFVLTTNAINKFTFAYSGIEVDATDENTINDMFDNKDSINVSIPVTDDSPIMEELDDSHIEIDYFESETSELQDEGINFSYSDDLIYASNNQETIPYIHHMIIDLLEKEMFDELNDGIKTVCYVGENIIDINMTVDENGIVFTNDDLSLFEEDATVYFKIYITKRLYGEHVDIEDKSNNNESVDIL